MTLTPDSPAHLSHPMRSRKNLLRKAAGIARTNFSHFPLRFFGPFYHLQLPPPPSIRKMSVAQSLLFRAIPCARRLETLQADASPMDRSRRPRHGAPRVLFFAVAAPLVILVVVALTIFGRKRSGRADLRCNLLMDKTPQLTIQAA